MRIHLLVVANRTAAAPELLSYLKQRAESGPVDVELVVPTQWADRDATRERVDAAVALMREAGLEVEARLGDPDPTIAVQDAWDPRRFDEVLVVTLPVGSSRWLGCDLPHRVERLTGATVHHLEARPIIAEEPPPPPPPRKRQPFVLAFLSTLRGTTRNSTTSH